MDCWWISFLVILQIIITDEIVTLIFTIFSLIFFDNCLFRNSFSENNWSLTLHSLRLIHRVNNNSVHNYPLFLLRDVSYPNTMLIICSKIIYSSSLTTLICLFSKKYITVQKIPVNNNEPTIR